MSKLSQTLTKTLSPLTLWGLGVGYVISGMFFGWSHGLIYGGVAGLFIATILMIVMYFCFVFSYCELCSLAPDVGGVFVYARDAFGEKIGFLAGLLQTAEFVFAAPAISLAIAAYLEAYLSFHHPFLLASSVYVLFTAINIFGISLSARLELVFTIIAVLALMVFFLFSFSHFNIEFISADLTTLSAPKVFAAIPFAIWFFLGIEGLANVSEETINPQKSLTYGFISAMTTLVILAFLTFSLTIGIGGWQKVVYTNTGAVIDRPILLALSQVLSSDALLFKFVAVGGLFGLVASFHGLLLVAGRALFKFCEQGYLLKSAGKISRRFHTPQNALLLNFIIGIAAIYSGKSDNLIIIAAFAALCCYLLSTLSMIKLRDSKPSLERPFKAPLYPYVPMIAVLIISMSILAMTYAYLKLALLFFITVSVLWYYEFTFVKK